MSTSVTWLRSRSLFGRRGRAVLPCDEAMDLVECAENDGELG